MQNSNRQDGKRKRKICWDFSPFGNNVTFNFHHLLRSAIKNRPRFSPLSTSPDLLLKSYKGRKIQQLVEIRGRTRDGGGWTIKLQEFGSGRRGSSWNFSGFKLKLDWYILFPCHANKVRCHRWCNFLSDALIAACVRPSFKELSLDGLPRLKSVFRRKKKRNDSWTTQRLLEGLL